ncbi:hypothetical protein EUTSA_v10024093mg [Eutrema salsugineum]|uniref:Uncharacterized protein n=1 Tax=Eutrema salsugineum TaxID=72664 RepID=V4MEK2_EUTSA|nr:hypothetical protein EUTSA_v10024093mg [Eutrema salsugineum]
MKLFRDLDLEESVSVTGGKIVDPDSRLIFSFQKGLQYIKNYTDVKHQRYNNQTNLSQLNREKNKKSSATVKKHVSLSFYLHVAMSLLTFFRVPIIALPLHF